MSSYIGLTFVRPDGSIGFDAMPCGEYGVAQKPTCLLTKHDILATSAHDALVQMARLTSIITPGLDRHACTGGRA
jgi:hypothetical protein